MRVLLVHQNFPAQFVHLAPALAALGHDVRSLGIQRAQVRLPGVEHHRYQVRPDRRWVTADGDFALGGLLSKFARAEACATATQRLVDQGWTPDLVYAHPGWGESMYLRDVCPGARHIAYAEYFYGAPGGDLGFDPEFASPAPASGRFARLKNTHLLHSLSAADGAVSPTAFQRSQHPPWAQSKIEVIHDGIDTDRFVPDPAATVRLKRAGLALRGGDDVVTFAARQLEPYRGYHVLMRALPELLRLRPHAQVIIVGDDQVSYGHAPPEGRTWRDIFRDEVASELNPANVHFVGRLPHSLLTQLMQVSAVHVYLTYPFVLSWSLLEAMSCGCLVVASRTGPVEEVIEHGRNGLLTDFFDHEALAHGIADALERKSALSAVREAARREVVDRFDLRTRCLPRQIEYLTASRG